MRKTALILFLILFTSFAATTTRLEISGDTLILTYSDSREPVIFRRNNSGNSPQVSPMKIDIPGTWTLDRSAPPQQQSANAPDVSRNALLPGIVGEDYSYTFRTTTKAVRWSVTGLPDGLRATQAGRITGKPTQAGTFSVDVTAETRTGKSSLVLPLKVFAESVPRILTETLPEGFVNASYDFTMTLNDSPVPFLMAAGIPEGLTLTDKGRLHGKPSTPGDYTLNITAINDAGESSSALALKITSRDIPKPAPRPAPKPAPKPRNNLRIPTSSMKQAFTGEDYSFTLKSTGGKSPVTWKADNLPAGLTLNPSTGEITGVPSADFKGKITFTATTKEGSVSRSISFSVKTKKPQILTALLPEGFIGVDYRTELKAEGGSGITWEFRGNIPDGLSMSKAGVIEGIPEKAGRFSLNASAVNSGGKASRRLTLRVSSAAKLDYVTAAVIPAVTMSADGRYDFPVSIDANIPAGSYIEFHSFPYGIEADNDDYSFKDSDGKETITVPANHSVTVNAWLEGGVVYEPVITARVKEVIAEPGNKNTNVNTSTNASVAGGEISGEIQGSYSGCNASGIIGAVIFLLVLVKRKAPRP